ncbi:hypothetical protein SDC9_19523 [bioreactor metagenome]|uniref:Uncharacterized protein n=1 Tax=bioreactor metagenome TaxID=1076179 RepID=A0A644U465_9ZZZZ
MDRAIADHRAQRLHLVDLAVDELLPAKARVHRHHADKVDHVEQILDAIKPAARVDRETRLAARAADRLQRAVNMRPGLEMGRDHIGAGLGEGVDIGIDRGDHQVHVHHRLDMRPDRLHQRRAEGQVRHEMPIHHVDMDPIGTLRFDRADLLPEVGEIGRENRRRDLDGAVKAGHGILGAGGTDGFSRLAKAFEGEAQAPPQAVSTGGAQGLRGLLPRERPVAQVSGHQVLVGHHRGALGRVVVMRDALHLGRGAEDEGRTRMQAVGRLVEDRVHAVGRPAAGLFDDEGDRCAFVDVAQAAALIALAAVARIEEHAAAAQDAVGFSDQRGDPAHVEIAPARAFFAGDQVVDIGADRRRPMALVRGVDGEFRGILGDRREIRLTFETAGVGIEDPVMHAVTEGHDQRALRPEDHVTAGDLLARRAQEARLGRVGGREDREDRADRDVDVDVRRAIERIDGKRQRARAEGEDLVFFFRGVEGHGRALERLHVGGVGHHVERLLAVAAGIGAAGSGQVLVDAVAGNQSLQPGADNAEPLHHIGEFRRERQTVEIE